MAGRARTATTRAGGGLRLTVLGAGYLGITHAACMASLGFEVLGVDTNADRVDQLNAGRLPIHEPGLRELLQAGLRGGRLRFSTSYRQAADFGDVHFICTGTPQLPGSDRADLSQVHGCVQALAPLLRRPCLVAGKSTVPVGTARRRAGPRAGRPGLVAGKSTVPVGTARRLAGQLSGQSAPAELAWNPEFLREGCAVADTLVPSRIVAGVCSPWAEQTLRRIYAGPLTDGAAFFVTGLETAELAKLAANSFLATKISFINAMAEVCEAAGGDVGELAQILGADPRIGTAFLRAGLGFGGGCLPKDIRAFIAQAGDLGAGQALAFLREVDAINLRRRTWTVCAAADAAGGTLDGKAVCVLGAAFKPDSDDIRDSPALDVARILHGMGAIVSVYDPAAMTSARNAFPDLRYACSAFEAAAGAAAVLLLTEWPEFTALDPAELLAVAADGAAIIDGRRALDPGRWRAAGWTYRAPGVRAYDCLPEPAPEPVPIRQGG